MVRVASFLDPRFKTKYLEHLSENELLIVKQTIVDECMSMCNECQQQEDTTHTTPDLSPAPEKHNLGTLFKNMKLK